jgi:TonB family protein
MRSIVIACAGAAALSAVLAVALHLHTRRQSAASAAQAATSQGRKPSAYGEAFMPPPAQRREQARVFHSAGGMSASAAQPYPNVAPEVMAAKLISAPPPDYPLLARMAHVRGQVTVQAIISSSGAVSSARALSGHRLLRGAALAAVRQRRYRPYRIGGQPANISTVVTVDFGDPS